LELKAIFAEGPKERRVWLKDISSNSKLGQRYQVRGVPYIDFILVMIDCALYG